MNYSPCLVQAHIVALHCGLKKRDGSQTIIHNNRLHSVYLLVPADGGECKRDRKRAPGFIHSRTSLFASSDDIRESIKILRGPWVCFSHLGFRWYSWPGWRWAQTSTADELKEPWMILEHLAKYLSKALTVNRLFMAYCFLVWAL